MDSSVLIHCYEMSRSACDELLSALESLGERVRVPVWCAKETWENTRRITSKRPLQKTAGSLNKRLSEFRNHSLRYVDERTFNDMSVEQYTAELDEAVRKVENLAKRVEKIESMHDSASARLIPFIESRVLSSDMVGIYAEVQDTGETRYTHEVPPGFGDGGFKTVAEGDEDVEESQQLKGKRKNRFGDLIMWLEILADCGSSDGEHLIVLTRDNTKRDWVHNPERVTDEQGGLQQNVGLITIPLPMLTQEAKRRCGRLRTTHVISLELFAQIMRGSFGARIGNLARALQAAARSNVSAAAERTLERPAHEGDTVGELSFGSADMIFEPAEAEADREIWQVLKDLKADGWALQNDAASRLPALLADAGDDELKQAGRALMNASNEDAVGPVETALQIVDSDLLSTHAKANVIIGLLAEAYFGDDGEPRKPAAHPDIVSALFEHGRDEATRKAYELAVTERLAPIKRLYLALPGEDAVDIRIEVHTRGGQLLGVQANDRELLESDAPESRRLPSTDEPVAIGDLLAALAREFVIPLAWLKVEGPTNFEVAIPERMGFIAWGPNTGEQLR